MLDIKMSDLNLIITDYSMIKIYNPEILDFSKCHILNDKRIFDLNIINTSDKILQIQNDLKDYFFLVCGSSNFHHLDVANLNRLKLKLHQKIQLVLIDNHMDCFKYKPESDILHCGNWVSFAYQSGIIDRVVMVGTKDRRKYEDFDHSIIKERDLLFHPKINKPFDEDFLDYDYPVYISIDTDILDVSSDWGKGPHKLDDVIKSPVWEQLLKFKLIGSCIMGHVTDNRKSLDLFKSYIRMRKKSENIYQKRENFDLLKKAMYSKIPASFMDRPLPINKQFEIILTFYKKILSLR